MTESNKRGSRVKTAAERRAAAAKREGADEDASGAAPPAAAPPAAAGGSVVRKRFPPLDRPVRSSITFSPGVRLTLDTYCVTQRLNFSEVCEEALVEFFESRGIEVMSVQGG